MAISCIFSDQMRACAVQAMAFFRFRWPFMCNIKQDQFHELCKETGAHLLHFVTKHKFGIETGETHIFWTIYFIKRLETNEKRELDQKQIWGMWIECFGVWACEKVLRHVTHAQGMCLGRSVYGKFEFPL